MSTKGIENMLKLAGVKISDKSKILLEKINKKKDVEITECDSNEDPPQTPDETPKNDGDISCPICNEHMQKIGFFDHIVEKHQDLINVDKPEQEQPEKVELRFEAVRHQAFDVYLNGKEIDTVFYSVDAKVDVEEVKKSLVDHDGYNPKIVVKKRKMVKEGENSTELTEARKTSNFDNFDSWNDAAKRAGYKVSGVFRSAIGNERKFSATNSRGDVQGEFELESNKGYVYIYEGDEMKKPDNVRNLAAKYAQRSGAGAHDIKGGKKAKRAKQREEFRKEISKIDEAKVNYRNKENRKTIKFDNYKKWATAATNEGYKITGPEGLPGFRSFSAVAKDGIVEGHLDEITEIGALNVYKQNPIVEEVGIINQSEELVKEAETDTNFLKDSPKEWESDKLEQNVHDKDKKFQVPNEVKEDLKTLQKELLKRAKDLKHEDSKEAQQEADLADVITDLLNHLDNGTVEEFKRAQVLATSLKSPMMHKLSPLFWDFMSTGGWVSGDGKKAKSLKDYFNIVKTDKVKK